jgi:hypothetical protein
VANRKLHRGETGDDVLGLKFRGERLTTGWLVAAALVVAFASVSPALALRPFGQRQAPLRVQRQAPGPRGQQGHAGQWLRRYKDMSPEQQRRALEADPQFRRLPPGRQEALRQRLQHFSSRPPAEQQRILNRMETWEHLTPAQKDQARQVYSQMKNLPPQRRQAVQNAIQALRGMPPEARQREIESERFRSQFSPEERSILGGASRLPLAPPEE